MTQENVEPEILNYTNYRVYLQDYYAYKKQSSHAFSLRFFAEKAGLSSHAHLKLVMDGKRSITRTTITKMLLGLGIKGKRAEYFEQLVFFNQAKSEQERQVYYEKLLKVSPQSRIRKLEDSQFRIFREWYHVIIREMVGLHGFKGSPEWISKKIRSKVSPKKVDDSLHLLLELGLLNRTAGGYSQCESLLATEDEVQNLLVTDFHKQMISLAADSLDEVSGKNRDISSVTIPILKKDFDNLKKHIQLMRKELLHYSAPQGEAEEVVQVNIQLFPLTGDSGK
jgi:uncharacterized protein (TIGR02147 family)